MGLMIIFVFFQYMYRTLGIMFMCGIHDASVITKQVKTITYTRIHSNPINSMLYIII